jgi:hypothetical protein
VDAISPTAEQSARGSYELGDVVDSAGGGTRRIGKAYRRVRMVEQLQLKGYITAEEAKALRHYRHHADMADRSPVRDSLNQQRGGSGNGPGGELLNAVRLVGACESAAGTCHRILRAVVVDDLSLTEWAMQVGGARDDCRMVRGERVCTVRPKVDALDAARQDIRIAAQRVMAELDA